MSEEILIPKMKRIDRKQRKIKLPILNLVLIIFCVFILIASTFVNIDLRHYILPVGILGRSHLTGDDFIMSFCLIPQVPALMFVSSAFGKKMAAVSVLLYIILGLTLFPFFALGGGLQYIGEYSFGYIAAYIPAVVVVCQFLKNRYSYLNMFLAALFGVLIIHCFGLIYMIFIALIKHDGGEFIKGWISSQSGLKILYDMVFSYVFIIIGKYVNSFIKFILS